MSDPNESALSSEVEGWVQEARGEIVGNLQSAGVNIRYFHADDFVVPRLRDLVRKALTVEAESARIILDLRRKLAIAGVEGSPPPGGQGTIPELLQRWRDSREQARALAEALRYVLPSIAVPKAFTRAQAALASWDTSQKESR